MNYYFSRFEMRYEKCRETDHSLYNSTHILRWRILLYKYEWVPNI